MEMSRERGEKTGNPTRWQSVDPEIGLSKTNKVLFRVEKFSCEA